MTPRPEHPAQEAQNQNGVRTGTGKTLGSGNFPTLPPRRVAVIGGGITGLSTAWHIHTNTGTGTGSDTDQKHEVHLFEKEDKVGGHAHTIAVNGDDKKTSVDVDVGFMVYNETNYPNMTNFFDTINVASENSDMSLSVSLDSGDTVEWSSDGGLAGLFAKRSQAFSPKFYSFLREMLRFNTEAVEFLRLDVDDPRRRVTTCQYLRDHGYSESFASYYLLPMMAALWSASIEDVLSYPAEQLVGFLCNHQMLQIFDRPQWKTVANRSQSYTTKVQTILGGPERVHTSTPIESILRVPSKSSSNGADDGQRGFSYELFTTQSKSLGIFDEVVFACPPTQAAIMLASCGSIPVGLTDTLSSIEFADNVVYVHSDPSLMPKRRDAWASWNCMGRSEFLKTGSLKDSSRKGEAMEGGASGFGHQVTDDNDGESDEKGTDKLEGKDGRMRAVYVTYWLNRLQNLDTDKNIFVSLNPHSPPDPKLVHKRMIMAHPQFTDATLQARKVLDGTYQGTDGLWFAGAWDGYGFHEDGCRSGFEVATAMTGVPLPWATSAEVPVLPPPDLSRVVPSSSGGGLGGLLSTMVGWTSSVHRSLTHDLPVALCKRFIFSFLRAAVRKGSLHLKLTDGSVVSFGDGTRCGCDDSPVTIRLFDDWFFVKAALEYDLGMARSYMSGHFVVEALPDVKQYDPVIRPPDAREESNAVLGDPIGLTRLFLLFIGNRDNPDLVASPMRSARLHTFGNALANASGLFISKIGSFFNYFRYKLLMDNSERGGSLKNIHAHYDLSNDLFTSFLDKETLMYSSAVYDAVRAPPGHSSGLVFRDTLEQAQWRKLDTLLDRAQVRPGDTVLDIGFGWGGLSLHAARKYGCTVHGITLSVEQMALATERVKKEGLGHLITFEVVDYRTFARRTENRGKFDRVLSCEMIEAVGHEHLGEFFWAVEQVLSHDGILVMEAITTPEARYETYRRTTDFINSIIFPGSCCPSLHALMDAAYQHSRLTLEHIDNIGLHYAQTLAEWRRRFNANESLVRKLGFDDVFMRVWNYYLTYCEAGFFSQTENCLILVFSRPGCNSLVPLCETRSVTQLPALTEGEVKNWLRDG